MTYVIGDVHGCFNTLLELLKRFDKDATVIFVGDLVDRGAFSREVIKHIRLNNYPTVLGNHERMMIEFGELLLNYFPKPIPKLYMHPWLRNGGDQTLQSYDLLKDVNDKVELNAQSSYFETFKEDLTWLKSLPLYLELDAKINAKNVVISHSCIANIWSSRFDESLLEHYALWARDLPLKTVPIFNIFGHTPTHEGVELTPYYANLDTGCYIKEQDLGHLSALCVESLEMISIARVKEDD